MNSCLSLHFVWDFRDNLEVQPILEIIQNAFARNKDFPFSRRLNLPLFFYCSDEENNLPKPPQNLSEKNIIFVFTSSNFLNENWENFLQSFKSSGHILIPIALEHSALEIKALQGMQAIRAYEFNKFKNLHIIINIAHEVYCKGLNTVENENAGNKHVKLFLSHCKTENEPGKEIALQLKGIIDTETTIQNFFDSCGIDAGEEFEKRIETEIKNSIVICINSDHYCSRFWCQKEILLAKKHRRPIIGVDCLTDIEDRAFPYKGNIPFIRYRFDEDREECLYRILVIALLETIRVRYVNIQLENYKKNNWLPNNTNLFVSPPEFWQLTTLDEGAVICYPEPPIYSIELEDQQIGKKIQLRTPLWNPASDFNSLQDRKIGISISDFDDFSYKHSHISLSTLKLLSQDVAKYIVYHEEHLLFTEEICAATVSLIFY